MQADRGRGSALGGCHLWRTVLLMFLCKGKMQANTCPFEAKQQQQKNIFRRLESEYITATRSTGFIPFV